MTANEKYPMLVKAERRAFPRIPGKFNDAMDAAFIIFRKMENKETKNVTTSNS